MLIPNLDLKTQAQGSALSYPLISRSLPLATRRPYRCSLNLSDSLTNSSRLHISVPR